MKASRRKLRIGAIAMLGAVFAMLNANQVVPLSGTGK